jgi:endonuclease YncB( thermonuclease family)
VSAQVEPGQPISARATLVTEGDTFEAHRPSGRAFAVRLFGVDAPELDDPYGRKAQAAARNLIGGKTIRVEIVEVGPNGHRVGRVRYRGRSLGKHLLRRGLARYAEERAPGASDLGRLERQARRAGRGLWAEAD